MVCWDFAHQEDWIHYADGTSFRDGAYVDLDPHAVARLPVISGDNFADNADNDDLISAFLLNPTLPRDIFELRPASAGAPDVANLRFDANHRVIRETNSCLSMINEASYKLNLSPLMTY